MIVNTNLRTYLFIVLLVTLTGCVSVTSPITVVDENQSPVTDATVAGSWSLDPSAPMACTTDGNGQCSLTSDQVNQTQHEGLTFTVNGISHATFVYEAAGNTDPDGDSDGTTITINKPS